MSQGDTLGNLILKAQTAQAPPASALESLRAHSRALGACLIFLDGQGRTSFDDSAAGGFDGQWISELGRQSDQIQARLHAMRPDGQAESWDLLPGVALAAAPYVQRRRVAGALVLAAPNNGVDARRLAAHAGVLMQLLTERLRVSHLEHELDGLSVQLSNTYEELSLIDQISGGMRVTRGASDFFRQACLDVMQVLNVRAMGVALYHEKFRQNPALFGEIKLPDDDVRRLGAQLEKALAHREGCLLLNDLTADQAFAWLGRAASVRQFLAVPLKRQDQIVGSLFALQKKTGDFNSVDSKLLTSIANESAIYLENAVLYGDVHELMMGLLHSLVSAVDAKDAYTCGHSERVALLSRDLAARIGLPDTQVERVYMSGLLHDVGKIGVPEAVLQKTGKLTPEEFEEIKKHPAIGAKILADVRQLEDVIPGVLYHHERYDGRGYPAGLAGRDIPLMGRLICLADCFDAMTSSRTYRKAMPVEVALTEIRRCSGTQFDPELADAFLQSDPQQIALLLKDHQHQAKRLLELPDSRRAA